MGPGLASSTRRGAHGRDSQGFAGVWELRATRENDPHGSHMTERRRCERRRGTGSAEASALAGNLVALHLPDERRARHPEYPSGVGLDVVSFLERLDDAGL